MKNIIVLLSLLSLTIISCQGQKESKLKCNNSIITEKLRYNEGSLNYNSKLLISNFGSTELNPLNNEGKGYIAQYNNGKDEILIKPDGYLNAPKGMDTKDGKLYIADVGKVVVYNLNDKTATPEVVQMPKDNLFVNDIVIKNNNAYISVTNTGEIYKLDLQTLKLSDFLNVPGANGMIIKDNSLYIASFSPTDIPNNDNVIYVVKDINNPKLEKFINRKGQYDGIAIHNNKLYFTDWVKLEVGYVDMITKNISILNLSKYKIQGPADISIISDTLYLPDLPNSRIIKIKL